MASRNLQQGSGSRAVERDFHKARPFGNGLQGDMMKGSRQEE